MSLNWMEQLEDMESHVEKEEEKKVETNVILENRDDLDSLISERLASFEVLYQLQELGEDVTEAFEIAKEGLENLLSIGKGRFGMTDEEIEEIWSKVSVNEQTRRAIR